MSRASDLFLRVLERQKYLPTHGNFSEEDIKSLNMDFEEAYQEWIDAVKADEEK